MVQMLAAKGAIRHGLQLRSAIWESQPAVLRRGFEPLILVLAHEMQRMDCSCLCMWAEFRILPRLHCTSQ